MNILLTNDDGVSAKGINTLLDVFAKHHNVYIIAPVKERSGCSSAITFKRQLKIEYVSDNIFAVHGFTADCVNIGLRGDVIPRIDLVISGINHGPNLGDDIYFSGTVAGARLAFMYGFTGIAISVSSVESAEYFEDAAEFLLNFINSSDYLRFKKPVLLNINYPCIPPDKVLGIRYARMGRRKYNDTYNVVNRNGTEMNVRFNFEMPGTNDSDSDIDDVQKGYITITPLTLDCTDYRLMNK